MVKVMCEKCGENFSTYPCRIKKGKHIYCSQKCHYATMKGIPFFDSTGIPSWNKGKKNHYPAFYKGKTLPQNTREKISKALMGKMNNFKGGRRNFRGYIGIYSPKHPYKDKNNCVREHRLVIEKHLGRFLRKEETVHHINGVKNDNRLENLRLFSNNQDHMLYHGKAGTIKGRPKKSRL